MILKLELKSTTSQQGLIRLKAELFQWHIKTALRLRELMTHALDCGQMKAEVCVFVVVFAL